MGSLAASAALCYALAYIPEKTATSNILRDILMASVQNNVKDLVQNYYRRQHEREADEYAAQQCKNPQALARRSSPRTFEDAHRGYQRGISRVR